MLYIATSIWTSKAAANAFVQADPHATVVERFKDWAGPGAAFVEWQGPDGSIN